VCIKSSTVHVSSPFANSRGVLWGAVLHICAIHDKAFPPGNVGIWLLWVAFSALLA
jgi:hypothetical protein